MKKHAFSKKKLHERKRRNLNIIHQWQKAKLMILEVKLQRKTKHQTQIHTNLY